MMLSLSEKEFYPNRKSIIILTHISVILTGLHVYTVQVLDTDSVQELCLLEAALNKCLKPAVH